MEKKMDNDGRRHDDNWSCFGSNDIFDKLFWGMLLLLGGSLWLMEELGYLASGWDNYFWPFIVIWLGVIVLSKMVISLHHKDVEKRMY